MNRALLLAAFLVASTFGLVGCAEKSSETTTATKDTPNGKVEVEQTTKTTKTGDQRDGR